MKKFFAFAISALFVLGLAASAFAIHAEIPSETQSVVAKGTTQVTIGGDIRVRGETRQNTSDFDDDASDRRNAWDQRVRLSVDAAVADNVQGLVMLEAGDGDTADTWTWGSGADGATGIYPKGNSKNGQVQVLQAWIVYKTDMVGLKVGHMPLALGNNMFFDHRKFGDDAVVVFADPQEGVHVAALTAKFDEGPSLTLADDADAYVALATYTTDAFGVGGDITWVHDKSFLGDVTNLYNIGIRGNAKVGPANIKADVEFQTGSVEAGAGDVDFGGMAVLVAGDMNVGGNTVGLEFGYGSGVDPASSDFDFFVTSLSSGVPYVGFVYDTRVAGACSPVSSLVGSGATGNGICGTTYVKGKAAVPLTEALKLDAAVIYLMASEDVNLNGGTDADDIGVEIDAKVAYSLAKNLKYWVEGGYLLPGGVYENAAGDADAAYALRHGIELSF